MRNINTCVVYNNDNRNKKPPFTKRTFYTLYTLCWIVVSTYVSVVCVRGYLQNTLWMLGSPSGIFIHQACYCFSTNTYIRVGSFLCSIMSSVQNIKLPTYTNV